MRKIVSGLLAGIVAIAGIFFIAGNWAWWNAWALIILMTIIGILTSRLFKKINGLAEERQTAAAKSKPWDVKIVRLLNIALPLMIFAAALDMRFHWFPPVPMAIAVPALIVVLMASMLTYAAIAANPFFSSHIRIQKERGHIAVSSGPYRWMRHPGYMGSLIFNLSVPFALGSWLPLPLGIVAAFLLIFRTAKEDQILTKELDGYLGYTQKVRYRLLPGIW